MGKRKGKKVYFAYPKPQQYMTYRMVVDSIVRETIVYTPHRDMRDAAGEVEPHVAKKKG